AGDLSRGVVRDVGPERVADGAAEAAEHGAGQPQEHLPDRPEPLLGGRRGGFLGGKAGILLFLQRPGIIGAFGSAVLADRLIATVGGATVGAEPVRASVGHLPGLLVRDALAPEPALRVRLSEVELGLLAGELARV